MMQNKALENALKEYREGVFTKPEYAVSAIRKYHQALDLGEYEKLLQDIDDTCGVCTTIEQKQFKQCDEAIRTLLAKVEYETAAGLFREGVLRNNYLDVEAENERLNNLVLAIAVINENPDDRAHRRIMELTDDWRKSPWYGNQSGASNE